MRRCNRSGNGLAKNGRDESRKGKAWRIEVAIRNGLAQNLEARKRKGKAWKRIDMLR